LFVTVSQLQREIRITFQICPRGNFVQRSDREYLASNFEYERIGSKRCTFGRARFRQTIFAELFEVHLLL